MRTSLRAFWYGAPIGTLGGLIGLGGAEFRLPVLKAAFGQPTHRAVALNLAVSMVTLVASLGIRLRVAPPQNLGSWSPVLLAVVAGSMLGAFVGPAYASRLSVEHLDRSVMVLLVTIGFGLILEGIFPLRSMGLAASLPVRVGLALVLGAGIGLISSLLGVAGGEVIIPTLVLVFGADIKTAGTLSVMISLPTVAVGIWGYARRGSYERSEMKGIVVPMGIGSVLGAFLGGYLLPYIPAGALKLALGFILIVSAVRIFRHGRRTAASTAVANPPGATAISK